MQIKSVTYLKEGIFSYITGKVTTLIFTFKVASCHLCHHDERSVIYI